MARKTRKPTDGRGSKAAIEKRRIARELNTLLAAGDSKTRLDGRTEKRRLRLIRELKNGSQSGPLKPHQVLQHTEELFEIGETFVSLRKHGVKPRRYELSASAIPLVKRHTKAFRFHPDTWRMLGFQIDSNGDPVTRSKTTRKKRRAKRR